MERIQKILSAAGMCSRRQAETYILDGRVSVNGKIAKLGDSADPDCDIIAVDGKKLDCAAEKLYLMLNKPRGYVTTLSDEKGRQTVAQLVEDCGARVYPVGRLDMDSDGLLLMTNDGNFTQKLTHPAYEKDKEYYVTVGGALTGCEGRLAALTELEDGSPIVPAQVRVISKQAGEWTISVTIHQGLNRQVRRMCALCDLRVKRLQRVREGSLSLGKLKPGAWRKLTKQEVDSLLAGK